MHVNKKLARKFSIEAKRNFKEKWKVLRHKVFIWRCQANETHVYLIISLMRHLILKGSIQQIYNILIMRKYILMWWLQLLFIIWLVWQFVKGLSLPLIYVIATYMYDLHKRIHMCIINSLKNLFCYKQTIQLHVNKLYPIDVMWIEWLREVVHLAYHIFLYA